MLKLYPKPFAAADTEEAEHLTSLHRCWAWPCDWLGHWGCGNSTQKQPIGLQGWAWPLVLLKSSQRGACPGELLAQGGGDPGHCPELYCFLNQTVFISCGYSNNYKVAGLKQNFIASQFWKSEVQNQRTGRTKILPKALVVSPFLTQVVSGVPSIINESRHSHSPSSHDLMPRVSLSVS